MSIFGRSFYIPTYRVVPVSRTNFKSCGHSSLWPCIGHRCRQSTSWTAFGSGSGGLTQPYLRYHGSLPPLRSKALAIDNSPGFVAFEFLWLKNGPFCGCQKWHPCNMWLLKLWCFKNVVFNLQKLYKTRSWGTSEWFRVRANQFQITPSSPWYVFFTTVRSQRKRLQLQETRIN